MELEHLSKLVRKHGARDGMRVAACVELAVKRGVKLSDALEQLRKHQPDLFRDA